MFDNPQEPKDMFADAADAKPSPVLPTAPAPSLSQDPHAFSAKADMLPEMHESRSTGKIVAIVLLSLVCMGGAGYVAYRFMVRNAVSQEVAEIITTPTPTPTPSTPPPTSQTPSPTPSTPPDTDGPTSVVDSDGDGLTNDEERALGTSVAKPDTDGDGLGDREEVKVYSTDPKKSDTDGDGYSDGDEVKNGYNPNGTGKLLQVPTK